MAELEQTFGVPVIESYGMTEAAHQMASNPLPPAMRKPGSVGLPAGPAMRIMDDEGHLLPAGATGEIVIRGSNVTTGYANHPQANEAAFTNGWFRTGDRGRTDADGYFYITGRTKELINRGGEKISPREIDEVLLEHPGVAQAIAFAVPHRSLGEDVAAAIVLRQAANVSEQELRAFAFSRLAAFKVPSQIVFIDAIPQGPTGKLQRIGLHEDLRDKLRGEYVSARTEMERRLLGLWREVLTVDELGVHDNFFGSGGDSLAAGRLVARINSRFALDLTVASVFRAPSIETQAILVESALLDQIDRE
jgi:acyl-CoA synthetase (AMP-forming)/AMP-acid ligase II